MEQTAIDRAAEAPHHQSGHHQRHAKIEVAAQEPFELRCRADLFFKTSSVPHVADGHELSPRSTHVSDHAERGFPVSGTHTERLFGNPGEDSCNTLAAFAPAMQPKNFSSFSVRRKLRSGTNRPQSD